MPVSCWVPGICRRIEHAIVGSIFSTVGHMHTNIRRDITEVRFMPGLKDTNGFVVRDTPMLVLWATSGF